MLSTFLLSAALALSTPADPLRAELDRVAARIEQLKAQRMKGKDVGAELDRLLVRSQELAAALEKKQPRPPRPSGGPGPDELRERADALRDEADGLSRPVSALDARIAAARRAADAQSQLQPQPPNPGELARFQPPLPSPAVEPAAARPLVEERARLAQRQAELREQAERLEAEAAALERE
ncbi:MAG: hypothetical protein QM767_21950 [Anaeromyxobacter sp.]